MKKKIDIGLIGETAVTMELLKLGYDVINLNHFKNNYKNADLICMNSDTGKSTMIQVKTGTQKNLLAGFISELDGTVLKLEEKIIGPWVFVYTDKTFSSMEFYVLTCEEIIELIKTSCHWYANEFYDRQLKKKPMVGVELTWLRGETTPANKNRPEYKSTLKESSRDRWDKLEDLLSF